MLLEAMLISGCIWGTSDACQSSGNAYLKQFHYDEQLDIIGKNIQRDYAPVWYLGIVGTSAVNKKYNAMLSRNVGIKVDFSDVQNENGQLYYKYGF